MSARIFFSRTTVLNQLQLIVMASLLLELPCQAGDWPQMLGPTRNGHAGEESLAKDWSKKQPSKAWSFRCGQGYAGPAVQEEAVLLFHREGSEEVLTCLSASDGERQWETRWKTSYAGGVDADQGPRCVPLIAEDRVYVYGAAGDLHCVSFGDGQKRWSRRLAREYQARDGYFGAGSGPLLLNNTVLVNVGGKRQEAGIVAVDPATGQTRWKTLRDDSSYSAPISMTLPQGDTAVFITRQHVIGVDPLNGKPRFQFPFGKTGPTVNAASPIAVGKQRLFVTASYGIGARLMSLTADQPSEIWNSDDVLSSQYPTPVLVGNYLFGVHGREDGALAELRCIDVTTGKIQWRQSGFGMAHLIYADGKLLVLRTEGELLLIDATKSGFGERGRSRITESTARAQPALAKGIFYVRETDGRLNAWKLP